MKDKTLPIKAESLLLVSVEPTGFEFILRPGKQVTFTSSELPQVIGSGLERVVYLPPGEFRMELDGKQLDEPPTLNPLDIVELELARLPKTDRPRETPGSLVDFAQAMEFRIEWPDATNAPRAIEILENVAQISVKLASLFPAKKSVFTMMESICVRLLAIGAIQVDYKVDDFGRKLYDVGRIDSVSSGQPIKTRYFLATNCIYPKSLTAEVQQWSKPFPENSKEMREARNS